ncbi:MAG: hypothetical protein ACREDP_21175, partial [Bradyrhizobium sp.]
MSALILRRVLLWNASAGPRLKGFIDEHLTSQNLDRISEIESKIYPNPLLCRFSTREAVLDQLYTFAKRAEINTSFGQQLMLPGFESFNYEN